MRSLGGFGRLWEVLGGFGRFWEALGALWEDESYYDEDKLIKRKSVK